MRIGVIGSGRIGATVGRLWAEAGHEVLFSFSRDPAKLSRVAAEAGARTGTPAEAAAFGQVVLFSVPWAVIDGAIEASGGLDGKVVLDTTNPYTSEGLTDLPAGRPAPTYNAERMPGARLVRAFNTLTAGFLAQAAGLTGTDRVAVFLAGEDAEAKQLAAGLIEDAGFHAVDLGGWGEVRLIEAPRRDGAAYGEAYRAADADAIAAQARQDMQQAGALAQRLKLPG